MVASLRTYVPYSFLLFFAVMTASCQGASAVEDVKSSPPKSVAQPSQDAPKDPLLVPYVRHYGVYLNGHKVGYMRQDLQVDRDVVMRVALHAKVAGLGTVSTIQLEEERAYDKTSGVLQRLLFSQTASTGQVRVSGKRVDDAMELSITAGQATQKQTVKVDETLTDVLAAPRLALRGSATGDSTTTQHFDASVVKNLTIEHRVIAKENRMLGGISMMATRLESKYTDLGIQETSWIDEHGQVLESQIGGFFVARLESEETAKKLDYQQDILVSAVVKTKQPITHAEQLMQMTVSMRGFGDLLPPASTRQQVKKQGDRVKLVLRKDASPAVAYPLTKQLPEDSEFIAATPFIQSEAPEIKAASRAAVGDAKDVLTATTRLVEFVNAHVVDEYVPAYSNALEAFHSRRGDCTEHAILFVAMARAVGIPARVAVGIAYWPRGGGFGWHAWAEVKASGHWYSVDPTWKQAIADVTHIKLAGGGPEEQAKIIMLLGQLQVVDLKLQ